jgi:hypothetical protein
LERTRKFFFDFVLKSLVPTQSSQDKEKFSCPFQSTDNFPEWKQYLKPVKGAWKTRAIKYFKFNNDTRLLKTPLYRE